MVAIGLDDNQPVRIKAAVLHEFGAPLEIEDVELADPKAGEVLVRLEACGVCHTDLYTASGADPSGYAPTVLGQEGAGYVASVRVRRVPPAGHPLGPDRPQRGGAAAGLRPEQAPVSPGVSRS
jgi:S-(hydroxymethyl)glutathione dehydrogenase/alcohol dehydrogenase